MIITLYNKRRELGKQTEDGVEENDTDHPNSECCRGIRSGIGKVDEVER